MQVKPISPEKTETPGPRHYSHRRPDKEVLTTLSENTSLLQQGRENWEPMARL